MLSLVMAINSRSKGKRGELEWAQTLKSYGIQARRGQQFAGSPDSPDVVTELDHLLYWEVKRDKSLKLWKWLEQAQREAPEGAYAILAHRRDREPWKISYIRSNKVMHDLMKKIPHKMVEQKHQTKIEATLKDNPGKVVLTGHVITVYADVVLPKLAKLKGK